MLRAWYTNTITSKIGYRGAVKKTLVIILIAIVKLIEIEYTEIEGITTLVVSFYTINELISILENIGKMGVPLPQKLIDSIESLKGGE